jgi:hypothetical protein
MGQTGDLKHNGIVYDVLDLGCGTGTMETGYLAPFSKCGSYCFEALQIITTCNEGWMPLSGMRKLLLSNHPREHRWPWLERKD